MILLKMWKYETEEARIYRFVRSIYIYIYIYIYNSKGPLLTKFNKHSTAVPHKEETLFLITTKKHSIHRSSCKLSRFRLILIKVGSAENFIEGPK